MNDYIVALLLGFSFGNLWLCALLVFSLQTTNRSTCGGYIVGRILAIVALSAVVAAIGKVVTFDKGVINLASGILIIAFSVYLAATRMYDWVPPWKKPRGAKADGKEACDGDCKACPTHGHLEYKMACDACGDEKMCAAEEPEVEELTRQARVVWKRDVPEKKLTGFVMGMTIGALRGSTLCTKLLILVPLLLSASIFKALGIGLSFSLSSSIYPLLGFVFGMFALKLVRYKRLLFGTSCLLLVLAGIKYVINGIQFFNL
jgi:hypothetical protein